jgi:hypothetical protein
MISAKSPSLPEHGFPRAQHTGSRHELYAGKNCPSRHDNNLL